MSIVKRKFVFACIVSVMLASSTGCQETPEEVQQFIDNKQELENKETKGDNGDKDENLAYDTIDNIFDTASEAFKENYHNLSLKEDYTLYRPSGCGEWKFKLTGGFDKEGERLLRHYIGDIYNEKCCSDGKNLSPPGPEYRDEENGIFAGAGENGFFIYRKNNIRDISDYDKVKDSFLLVNGYEDAEYKLADGSMKVSEAVGLAQKTANEWSGLAGDFKYLPYRVTVFENEKKGEFAYQVEMQKVYENTIFFQIPNNIKDSEALSCMEIDITSVKGQANINNPGMLEFESEVSSIDKIVSLKSALKLISKKLSSYYIYKVDDISFENVLFPEKGANLFKPGSRFVSKPYWVIYFKSGINNEDYAAVNAVTGEVSYVIHTYQ